MTKHKHRNLRTLQFTFEKYKHVLEAINAVDRPRVSSVVIQETLEYCLLSAINHKNGKSKTERRKGVDVPNLSIFPLIDDLVFDSKSDPDRILTAINEFIEDKQMNADLPDDPLKYIFDNWLIGDDDCKIEQSITELIANLHENKYSPYLMPRMFECLCRLHKMGFEIDLDKVIGFINKNNSVGIQYECSYLEIPDGYDAYVSKISNHRVSEPTNLASDIDTIIGNANWTEDLLMFLHNYRYKVFSHGSFLTLLPMPVLKEKFLNGKTLDFHRFRQILHTMYGNKNDINNLANDLHAIKDLKSLIEEIQNTGLNKRKVYHSCKIIEQLIDILETIVQTKMGDV